MERMMNRIVLVGRLTADPEEGQTRGDSPVALSKFRLAVDRPKRRDAEKESDFFNVACFGRTAEFVNRYLRKGDLAGVEGRLQMDEYTDRDGQRQRWVEVRADNVRGLGSRNDREEASGGRDDRPAPRDRDSNGRSRDADPFGD